MEKRQVFVGNPKSARLKVKVLGTVWWVELQSFSFFWGGLLN